MTDHKAPTYRVLVVEDDIDHCDMIEDCLDRGGHTTMDIVFAHTVTDACRILAEEKFSFILLDHNLPDGHGCDVLERMEERLLTTPIVGLSASSDPEVVISNFRAGAIDFLTKHEAFQGQVLRQRVMDALSRHKRKMTAAVIESHRRLAGIAQSEEELVAAARTDPLMGILNRAAFDDIHNDLNAKASATGASYGLCIIDLDRFKQYNDTYGHAAGDVVLKRVADALRSAIRPSDIVARYGGEEIVALLSGADYESIKLPVTRMIERVAALNIPHEHNEHGLVTVSAGAAAFSPFSAESVGELFERADKALYEAKAAGRNQYLIAA